MKTEKTGGLSKRERTLVLLLAAIGLFYLAFTYGIKPAYNQLGVKQNELNALAEDKTRLELTLMSQEAVERNHNNALSGYTEIKDTYPSIMPDEDLDRLLTGLCRDNRLSPVSLNLSDPVDFTVQIEGAEPKPAVFCVVSANMTVNGTIPNLMVLLNAVEEIEYIRVARLSFGSAQQQEDASIQNISMLFEIVMFKE